MGRKSAKLLLCTTYGTAACMAWPDAWGGVMEPHVLRSPICRSWVHWLAGWK